MRSTERQASIMTRFAMMLMAMPDNVHAAAQQAHLRFPDTPEVSLFLRSAVAAATTTDASWASSLAGYADASKAWVQMAMERSVIGSLGLRPAPLNTQGAVQVVAGAAGWVEQGKPIAMTSLGFANAVVGYATFAFLAAVSRDLVRFWSPGSEAFLQSIAQQVVAVGLDHAMLSPLVTATTTTPGSITSTVTAVHSGGSTPALITSDIISRVQALLDAGSAIENIRIVSNPRSRLAMSAMRDSSGAFAFPELRAAGPSSFLGIPFLATSGIPLVGSPAEGYVVVLDGQKILYADDGLATFDIASAAAVQFDTAPSTGAASLVSLWQNNLVGLKINRLAWWTPAPSAVEVIDRVAF